MLSPRFAELACVAIIMCACHASTEWLTIQTVRKRFEYRLQQVFLEADRVLLPILIYPGKICVNHQWTYSKWVALAYNPSDTFSLLIFIFLLLAVLVPIACTFFR